MMMMNWKFEKMDGISISSSTKILLQPSSSLKLIIIYSILLISSLSNSILANKQSTSINKQNKNDEPSKDFADHSKNDLDHSESSVRAQLIEPPPSTSPSITSVHQVWTSASSGRLDELSPEIIGKLRSDVPFLAAYALRPRLVGGSNRMQSLEQREGLEGSGSSSPTTTISQGNSNGLTTLETGASSPQGATESLVPKLGDFSEFRVETSSTSKSEHHHKRKTSLKRREDVDDNGLRMKKRVLAEASQLIRKRQRSNKRNRLATKSRQGNGRGGSSKLEKGSKKARRGSRSRLTRRKKGALLRSQARAGRLRAKLNRRNLQHHMNIIRHGRYQQQDQSNDVDPSDQLDRSSSSGLDGETKGGSDGGVKGGSKVAGRKPFYSKVLPADRKRSEDDDNGPDDNGNEVEPTTTSSGMMTETDSKGDSEGPMDKTVINEVDGEEDVELDRLPEPKRVGDPDVDEVEGDTVTVMPKSDGVDDDPEIPTEDYEDDSTTEGPATQKPGKTDSSDESDSVDADEPRTKRVNRERQNDSRDRQSSASGGGGETSNVGGGGGIGATVGGNDNSGSGVDDNEGSTALPDDGKKVESGVEFADDADGDGKDDGDRKTGTKEASPESSLDEEDDDVPRKMSDAPRGVDQDEPIGSREFESKKEKPSGGRRVAGSGSDSGAANDNEDNDSINGDSLGSKATPRPAIEPSTETDVDYRDDTEDESDRRGGSTKSAEESAKKDTEKKHKTDNDCNDGSYNHHDDHHHHHHHDSIKWLQDAIPGEPKLDYPILSRANVTNFSCSDQKYPGYYADVEARCQVFHICQADGRQDSFLCPNGTIFSQRNYVCVWWNSFDCEDAPKYYDLNALLYKSGARSKNKQGAEGGFTDLRPLDGNGMAAGARDRSNAAADDDDEESSIDSLIRDMGRRNKANGNRFKPTASAADADDEGQSEPAMNEAAGGSRYGGRKTATMDGRSLNGIGPDEDATIQRKSTNIDDADDGESSGLVGNSRLRASNAEPRRKRRASVRQMPPKLKSRRVSRNSRRRKLRHGIKPKRRA